jgi:hypothetical protein
MVDRMSQDPDLETRRGDPEFEELATRLKRLSNPIR